MFELKIIPHSDVTEELLDRIIKIKSVAWPYSYEKQWDWISQNLKSEDLHVLLTTNEQAVGYLNLISIDVKLDTLSVPAYGIGNVCALEKGKGYGGTIIVKTNEFLVKSQRIGLLFCKDPLVRFYSVYHWELVEQEHLQFQRGQEIRTMIYNSTKQPFEILDYHGKLF